VVFLSLLGVLCATRAVHAAEEKIQPGDKVRVTIGPAPVKIGKKTLATVDGGTELTALKVQGNWVKVTIEKDGKKITGWIHTKRLSLIASAEAEPKTPDTERRPKEQPTEPGPIKKPYDYGSALQRAERASTAAWLAAYGLLPKGSKAGGLGATADVRVSDTLVVTGVPKAYIEGCAAGALAQAAAETMVAAMLEGKPKPASSAPKGGWPTAKTLALWWAAPRRAEIRVFGPKGKLTMEELIRSDGQMERALKQRGPSAATSGPMALPTDWLLFPKGLSIRPKYRRRAVSFRALLTRFEPEAPVTEANADAVAEELIWTKALGLSHGTFRTLPDARRRLQAAILEALDFEIGDPAHADEAGRAAALKKLAEAKKQFMKLWNESHKPK